MDATWLRFLLAALATWRLATLLTRDDGPWDLVLRLRRAAGNGAVGRMLDCFRCVSLWVAAPLALAVGDNLLEWLLAWLALSGAACLLDRLGQPPVRFERWDEGGDAHGLLRAESSEADEPGDDAARRVGAADDTNASLRVVR